MANSNPLCFSLGSLLLVKRRLYLINAGTLFYRETKLMQYQSVMGQILNLQYFILVYLSIKTQKFSSLSKWNKMLLSAETK